MRGGFISAHLHNVWRQRGEGVQAVRNDRQQRGEEVSVPTIEDEVEWGRGAP